MEEELVMALDWFENNPYLGQDAPTTKRHARTLAAEVSRLTAALAAKDAELFKVRDQRGGARASETHERLLREKAEAEAESLRQTLNYRPSAKALLERCEKAERQLAEARKVVEAAKRYTYPRFAEAGGGCAPEVKAQLILEESQAHYDLIMALGAYGDKSQAEEGS